MFISEDYLEFVEFAINQLHKKNINFGEVRYTKEIELKVIARDKEISEIKRSNDQGIGIRVQFTKDSPLTFVSTSNLTKKSISTIIEEAIEGSKTLSQFSNVKIALSPQSIIKKDLKKFSNDSLINRDITEIKDYVITHSSQIKEIGVSSASCGLAGLVSYKHIMTTEGTEIKFLVDGVGYRGDATIREMGKFQTYLDRQGGTFGFKRLETLIEDKELAKDIGNTVKTIIKGKSVQTGSYDVIIDPAFAGLLAHESFGHMTEADSVTNNSSALGDRLGERFAPEFVSIVDDATLEDGAWNFVDDEGTLGLRTVMLNNGVLEKYISDRLNANKLGTISTGNSRAQDYGYAPIVRMTNTCFKPQDYSLDEMISEIKNGIYCKGHAGGEAGTTGKFSFRSQVGYLIKDGELVDTLVGPTLNGNILEYLNKIDAVGKDFELTVDCGFGGCGKGGQRALVGLGGTHIRFRNVAVTGAKKMSMPKGMMMK